MHAPEWTRVIATVILASIAGSRPCPAEGFLRTRGRDIVDEKGRKVLLRGVGLGNWMLPEGYMWRFGDEGDRPRKIERIVRDLIGPEAAGRFWTGFRKNYITESDIRRISELGFNSVRPALNARLFLTEGDEPAEVEEGYDLLDALVGWAKKHGIYVILDMHGAPGGQTGANIDDSPNDKPELFSDPRNQDRLVAIWVKLAERYKDEPTVAAYDLLNEPLPERTGAAARYKATLEPLYRRITQAIRAVDGRHMITLEGADWSNDWSVFSEPFDDNLFYQFHYYCWDQPTQLKGVGKFLALREKLGRPVWVGETGEKDNTIYWGTTQYFEANDIGWSFWPWKKMDTRNTPLSIVAPEGWDAIRAYTRGGPKPSRESAQKTLDLLLENVKCENCVYFSDVVNAILRRVPGRVEAENYGHEGPNISYSVKDAARKSKAYRTEEPVLIEPLERMEGNRGRSGAGRAVFSIEGEWTSTTVESLEAKSYELVLRVKAEGQPAIFKLSWGDQSREIALAGSQWQEVRESAVVLAKGPNRIRLAVTKGGVRFDWMEFQ